MAFSKILIANRGEIAHRVMRTARALGYATVAVYSDADRDAPHVLVADEAVHIGPAPAVDSYLAIDALIAAAKRTGADAVHPGYGFLSENDAFAAACEAAGLVFIGPTPAAIRAMGNKAAAKRLMIEAGVPCVPGYQGLDQSDARLIAEAERIGFPVMVKAAAGGGGRGMRLVEAAQSLPAALTGARSEAQNAFGSAELILEKAVRDARHVEIQVFGDAHGHVIHLGERDCSVQRRHQKVVEEAPCPMMTAALREKMGAAAVAASRAINYRGAGTVEFLLGGDGAFYFLEMNTRLQVEHPVTEAITGLDLVALQLQVADGDALPITQDDVRFDGHAIEVRLCAEDPDRRFLPQVGRVALWDPAVRPGVRIDHALASGLEISPHYDSMIAKIIAHGRTRDEARRRLIAALGETTVLGLATNRSFLIDILQHPEFTAGQATTSFVPTHYPDGAKSAPVTGDQVALAAILLSGRATNSASLRSTGVSSWPMKLAIGKTMYAVSVVAESDGTSTVTHDTAAYRIRVEAARTRVTYDIDGYRRTGRFVFDEAGALHLDLGGRAITVRDITLAPRRADEAGGDRELVAPMNGRIVGVFAKPGDRVRRGQRIIVLEAMKMQHEITAARDGVIETVRVKDGDQVAARQVLAALAAG
jgi:geranyl-CoA carboxylase alpha subunit